MTAYSSVAASIRVSPTTVRSWISHFEMYEVIPKSERGHHSKVTYSPIVDDPEFREEFKIFVRENSRPKGGGKYWVGVNFIQGTDPRSSPALVVYVKHAHPDSEKTRLDTWSGTIQPTYVVPFTRNGRATE